jgi:hypothetical protein
MFTHQLFSKWTTLLASLCVLSIVSCSQQKNQSKVVDFEEEVKNTPIDIPAVEPKVPAPATVTGTVVETTRVEPHSGGDVEKTANEDFFSDTPIPHKNLDEVVITKSFDKRHSAMESPVTLAMPFVGESKTVTGFITDDAGTEFKSKKDIAPREDMVRDVYSEEGSEMGLPAVELNSSLAGQLTAGEINDFKKWTMWEDLTEGELKQCALIWQVNPKGRYSTLVQTESGAPVVDCVVELVAKNDDVLWSAKTDNTGKAELWAMLNEKDEKLKLDRIEIKHAKRTFTIKHPIEFEKGLNIMKIPVSCDMPQAVDICFTVDATGSMGDEIAYLQAELMDVITKVKTTHTEADVSLGSVFYRDKGDTYLTRNVPFTKEVSKVNQFIAEQYADGGGDGPEAVDEALNVSINQMDWHDVARARLLFLVLDAPPHGAQENLTALQNSMVQAAAKGIRIIPLVASGGGYDVDKSLEYLMRCMALSTNGTYAFLTNHSGIGGHHTEPSTDSYKVETLNELLQRVIGEYLLVPDCDLQQFVTNQQIENDTVSVVNEWEPMADSLSTPGDSSLAHTDSLLHDLIVIKCFPNPATDYVWVETSSNVKELYLADNSGKLMQRMMPASSLFQLDLTFYPSGIYFLKAWINDKWVSARIVVARLH